MRFFEEEISKYERRLKRIGDNPSPSMLVSNRLLYEAMLEHNKEQLRWWREGKRFIATEGGTDLLVRCFGDFRPIALIPIADRMAPDRAEACFDRVRGMGLPDYACDRTILFLPLAIVGDDLPKPAMVIARTGACEVAHNTHRALAKMMGIPVYTIDVPFSDPHEEHLDYNVAQLKELIKYVEGNIPGAQFNGETLIKWLELERRYFNALHDIYELRKLVPCPDHPRDVFREPHSPSGYAVPSVMVDYYEAYRDELKERVKRGFVPVGEEKLRIVWGITGPYGSNVWDYLASRGVSVPFWHYGQALRNFAMPFTGDEMEFGRRLKPLEEVSRFMLYNSWAGDGERWIRDTVHSCKEFKADGFVYFDQTGCQPVLGLAELVKTRLEQELGIPMWYVEGRMLLGRSERTNTEFMAGLESFLNLCFNRKQTKN